MLDCVHGRFRANLLRIRFHTYTHGWMGWVQQLRKLYEKKGLPLSPPLIEGTMKGLHGSAVELMEFLYQSYTGKECVPHHTVLMISLR
eukprot:4885029-Pyramimonas_sp.AAC.1